MAPRSQARAQFRPIAGKSSWSAVRGETLSWRIAQQIRAALFAGQIRPGEALGSESHLAERFGVSRMAMRDALRALAATGIVDIRVGAKGGVFIAQGDYDRFADALAIQFKLAGITIAEMFDSQIAIEVMATELAAQHADETDLQRLRHLLGELQALSQSAMTPAKALRFTEVSMQFHEALVGASHNRALAAQFKALRFVLEPVYARRTTDRTARRVIASHKRVLDCIAAHDAAGACSLMRQRLQTIRAYQLLETVET